MWTMHLAKVLPYVWNYLAPQERRRVACVSRLCYRASRFALLGPGLLGAHWIRAITRALDMSIQSDDVFDDLFFLLALPPLLPHRAPLDTVARAHQRINCGHVRLIEVVHGDLVFRIMAGMSRTKRHDVRVSLSNGPTKPLPAPVCDCVNSAAIGAKWRCVHAVLVEVLLERIYFGWEKVIISPNMSTLFQNLEFLHLSQLASDSAAQRKLRLHIEKYYKAEIVGSKLEFLHGLPRLRTHHVRAYEIHVHPFGKRSTVFGEVHKVPKVTSAQAVRDKQSRLLASAKKKRKVVSETQVPVPQTRSGRVPHVSAYMEKTFYIKK